MRFLKRFIFRTKTIYQFLKLGWEDYWFDSMYLEKLIIWKLNQMSQNFNDRGFTQNSKKKSEEMKKIADKLYYITEKLEDTLYEKHRNKFPNKPC